MKHLINLIAVAFSVVLLSSCGDSHNKIMNDQLSWLEEMTDTLNRVSDGDLSSSDAAKKIKALGRKGEEFMERKKVLNENASPEELREIAKEHSTEIGQAFKDYMLAVQRLSESGRSTRELVDAIENMKTP